jgi:hypothetical protein
MLAFSGVCVLLSSAFRYNSFDQVLILIYFIVQVIAVCIFLYILDANYGMHFFVLGD